MNKKLIGIATIILILGIILGIGIRNIKASPRLNKVAVLDSLGVNANSQLLANLSLKQLPAGLDQRHPSLKFNNALQQKVLQGLLSPDALTGNNLDLLLPGLSS